MTVPALPAQGDTSWYDWAQGVHEAVTTPGSGTVSAATTAAAGIVELATTTEATTGTDTTRAVTPAGVKAVADTKAPTSHTHGVTDLTATGTKSATTFLRGDNTWATPAGGGSTTDASLLTSGTLPPARIGDASVADAKLASGTALTPAERTKLSGVATGATANSTDAALRDRATHTGTQLAATVSDLTPAVQGIVGSAVVAGENVAVTYDEVTGLTEITAITGGLTAVQIADLPAGTVVGVKKIGTTWTRPTTRTDLLLLFKGAEPGPNTVIPPATNGMYDATNAFGDVYIPTPS